MAFICEVLLRASLLYGEMLVSPSCTAFKSSWDVFLSHLLQKLQLVPLLWKEMLRGGGRVPQLQRARAS